MIDIAATLLMVEVSRRGRSKEGEREIKRWGRKMGSGEKKERYKCLGFEFQLPEFPYW